MRTLFYTIILSLLGCSGGGSGGTVNTTADIAALIEHKDFYRVVTFKERYYKENFDGNGTLSKNIYFMDDSFDDNTTVSYSIEGSYVYITETDRRLKCSIEDNNRSVIFKCSNADASASARLSTYRWLSLEEAKENRE